MLIYLVAPSWQTKAPGLSETAVKLGSSVTVLSAALNGRRHVLRCVHHTNVGPKLWDISRHFSVFTRNAAARRPRVSGCSLCGVDVTSVSFKYALRFFRHSGFIHPTPLLTLPTRVWPGSHRLEPQTAHQSSWKTCNNHVSMRTD